MAADVPGFREETRKILIKDGAELSNSRTNPGKKSPLARDVTTNDLSQVLIGDRVEEDTDTTTSRRSTRSTRSFYVRSEPQPRPADRAESALDLSQVPDPSRLVPLAVAGVVGVAAVAAGVGIANHLKRKRENERAIRGAARATNGPPAGWYEMLADPSRLRYWNGATWTDHIMPRTQATVAAADWYPDPSDAAQLRYWDGTTWTHHIHQRGGPPATPADWYPDPSNAAQLRFWDGTAWTDHVTSTHVTTGVAHYQPSAPPAPPWAVGSAHDQSRITMTSAQWQAHVRAWMAAGAIEQELWRRLSNAHISDADQATLEAQRNMEQLTPEQGAQRIRLMLEANPALRGEVNIAKFMTFIFESRSVQGQGETVSIDRTN